MRFRKGNYEFSLLGPISAKKNLYFYVFDHPKNFASFSLGFHISEKRSERLKTYPSVDLPSRSHAFGVVTALPFVRRWVPRGGSLVILSSDIEFDQKNL